MKRWSLALLTAISVSSLCAVAVGTNAVAQPSPPSLEQQALVPRAMLFAQLPTTPPAENPVVFDQPAYQPVPDWRTLFPAPVWSVLLGVLSTVLTVPLTGILKSVFKTDGINTVAVNAGLNTFFTGIVPWLTGVYPPSLEALFYVLIATVVGMIMDKLSHFTIKQVAAGKG